jgi:hypothetical protein
VDRSPTDCFESSYLLVFEALIGFDRSLPVDRCPTVDVNSCEKEVAPIGCNPPLSTRGLLFDEFVVDTVLMLKIK